MPITWMQLQAARERAGYTQAELADLLGVSTRTIVNWEANGVPRKSEYKVLDVLGTYLYTIKKREGLGKGIGKLIPEGGFNFPKVDIPDAIKSASDEQLLNELLSRAIQRRQMSEGKQPRSVSGMTDDELSNLDLSQGQFALAATHDFSTVEEQSHPDYEEESQDHED